MAYCPRPLPPVGYRIAHRIPATIRYGASALEQGDERGWALPWLFGGSTRTRTRQQVAGQHLRELRRSCCCCWALLPNPARYCSVCRLRLAPLLFAV